MGWTGAGLILCLIILAVCVLGVVIEDHLRARHWRYLEHRRRYPWSSDERAKRVLP